MQKDPKNSKETSNAQNNTRHQKRKAEDIEQISNISLNDYL